MKEIFLKMKALFTGTWAGEGFAKFPTIDDTAYTEQLTFEADDFKDVIFFRQKTLYKNNTEHNGKTVFWDTGFFLLKEGVITLNSVQVSGRIEVYLLAATGNNSFTFNSSALLNDPKSLLRSQRIFTIHDNELHYELNMATCEAEFQNHLRANLTRTNF